ncbi:autotransporter outer membrane beta-barrel domain-containing protein [Chromobacterium violaceum]|uniref:autotransporter outer membrane beta-barrel domain-containing protein n=1 Tax=Chromobacterium violaceum TaxID=536 RepID=UPI0009DA270F|nr:autotransporter domain-containing protein [Chromobacterium violaceum]MBX9268230.1 autotransporter domain-containing protein [Chromobacterium violaceum]MCD0491709.1 autotransporter domain-containing protein [Chromobacterium violaceum]QRO31136.1 autotransporter domain-containing protein [Chromobacterium violaceum]QRQ19063.1 autotransporter domain-containing protein [Chromobacterium violaceum]
MMRNRLTTLALATALALPAAAHAYSNIYFFGDSLTDIGAFGGLGGLPSTARWTLGYGPGWSQDFGGRFGIAVTPNNPNNSTITAKNGNNYAQGDARAQPANPVNTNPESPTGSPVPGAINVSDLVDLTVNGAVTNPGQISTYLAQSGGKADPNALYSIWIGGNDVINSLTVGQTAMATALAGGATQAQAQTAASNAIQSYLTTSATNTVQAVGALKARGANTILLPNLPNIATAPLAVFATINAKYSTPADAANLATAWGAAWNVLSASPTATSAALVQQALAAAETSVGLSSGTLSNIYSTQVQPTLQSGSSGYNQLVDMQLVGAGLSHGIIRANINGLFNEILANPTAYGLTNTSGSACPQSALYCNAQVVAGINYLFTDPLHPTPQAYKIVSDYFYGLTQAPYFAAAIPESSLNNARQLGGALDARYQAIRSQKRAVGEVSAFVNGAFGDGKASYGGLSAKPKGQLYTVGLDFQATPALSVGLAMSRQQGKTDVDSVGTPGSIDDRTTLMSGFASYNQDKFWVDGDLHIGSGDLDTHRNVTLGPTTVGIDGKTRATQFGLRAAGGYRMQYRGVTTGPVAGLDYAYAKIAGFAEQGGNSSSMSFSSQNVSSLVGRVGWQLDAEVGRFSPYAKVSFAHEFKQNDRSVTAGLATTVGDWTTNLGKPDANWMEWTAGVSANFNKTITAFGQLTATSGKNGGNQTGGNIGVAMSF